MKRGSPRAFTLIETLAVLALLALLTAAVAVSLKGAARAADMDDVLERFITADRNTREIARRFGRRPEFRFDLNQGTVSRFDNLDSSESRATPIPVGGARVAKLIVRGESIGYGEQSIAFSAGGRSPSYAVLLSGKAGQRWVAFAGLTGQAVVLRDERQVQDILSGSESPDAAVAATATPTRADAR
jgi:prepilin-type N-terminal cleavage/methylation domain-containing protein